VKQVTQKIEGPIEKKRSLAMGKICRQGEHKMRLRQLWRPRICQLVLRSWELGGRRDRQGPEKGKVEGVVIRVQGQWKRIIGMNAMNHRQLSSD